MFHYRNTFHFPKVLWQLANADLADAQNKLAALTAGGRVPADDELMAAEKLVADAETELAFALGWMTHCGTDVTGHPFTNAKCGGPFRLHWQRHHLVENHFDAAAYNVAHMGDTVFEELGTSALHFRIAFRTRTDAPYNATPRTLGFRGVLGRYGSCVPCQSLSLFSQWRRWGAGIATARVSRRGWRAVPRSAAPGSGAVPPSLRPVPGRG
jgi:hypothetical protein